MIKLLSIGFAGFIADSLEKIEQFLPSVNEMITDGLVTLERVRVIQHKG